MTDATCNHMPIDEMESIWRGLYVRARGALKLGAFGLGVMRLPADFERMPAHMHKFDGQEEVYIPLEGSGWIELGGERKAVDPQTAVRVGPDVVRRLGSGSEGMTMLIAGGTPGKAYEPFAEMETGAPEPDPASLPGIRDAEGAESSDDWTLAAVDGAGAIRGVFKGVTFYPLGRALGQRSFGIAVLEMEPGGEHSGYPLHKHDQDRQVEVYVAAEGSGHVIVDGSHVDVGNGEMVAIGPDAERQWFAGAQGLRLIALGAPEGKAYEGNQPTLIETEEDEAEAQGDEASGEQPGPPKPDNDQ